MEPDVHYSDARVPCKICGRSFAPEVLQKHSNICKKNAASSQKRKTFDSSKQRVVEGEISFKQIRQAQKQVIKPPKSHWREKHEDFINAIRNARGVQKALDSGGPLPPPPPPSINPDYIQCPYCSRRFSQQAAERHINFCKEQQSRLPRAKPDANATAKQNARLGYQAPKLKPKAPAGVSPGVGGTGAGGMARGGARMGAPPARGAAARGGAAPSRGGAAPGRGRAAATPDSYGLAGDSRGGGHGRQQQQRAGSVPRAHSFEHPDHEPLSQRQQHRHHNHQQQHHHNHPRQQQHVPYTDTDEVDDFYSSPQDFYTPYVSPRHRAGQTGAASSNSRYADTASHTNKNNSSYSGRYHHQQQQQQPQYSSRSNGSDSPYQNLEERSRRADGVPVRARVSPDSQQHYLSAVDGDDVSGGKMHPLLAGATAGSITPGGSRRGHLQTTPAPFCYECGAKYPVSSARFCCQCGVKRASCR